ncbi:hypothetical protein V6N11_042436 [Hibiscus sabdariffa]|uniref:RNase H type-1 domain-containing protein n=1 Tax=Hibiscus sabdariffa TaxID=183260 RepID=A0ABR2QWY0_9ROSI
MRNNWVFNGHRLSTESIYHKSVTWARYYAKSSFFTERVQSGSGYVGGVFRAHDSGWILGFNKSIGVTQPLQFELWTILTSLHLVRDNGFERLLIQSDNLKVITRLNASTADSDVNALVRAIARLRNVEWETMFRWIPHEANKLADAMPKFDASYDISIFAVPPTPCNHF